MKDIAIYGAGGLGRETATLINDINRRIENPEERYRLIGFFVDGRPAGEPVAHFGKTLGGFDALNTWPQPLDVVIAIATPRHLKRISESVTNPNINFPNLIHPLFHITDRETFRIGRGNLIQAHCTVTTNVAIGDFNILNGSVVIGHDSRVGNYNVFMPDIRISGDVHIGNENVFGVKSLVIQGLRIGNNVTIGAGAVMLTRPKNGATYLGNPAKQFKYKQ